MKHKDERFLPTYPRTLHLPWKPNAQRDDLVAAEADCDILFKSPCVWVEEKIDGANCAMALVGGHPIIRNRDHIMRKGYVKKTPAKMQFTSVWNWFYTQRDRFQALESVCPGAGVYGEWMYAQHGLEYDCLPELFIAYDLYDYEASQFIRTDRAIDILRSCGFTTPPLLHAGSISDFVQLEEMTLQVSPWTTKGFREGVYVKASADGRYITHRFKMVRQGFTQGGLWSQTELRRNTLGKSTLAS